MADAPAPSAPAAASTAAPSTPANPAPPEAATPAPAEARLVGRDALAVFMDLEPEGGAPEPPKAAAPATGSSPPATAGTAPASGSAPAAASAPASGDQSQPSTGSPSNEPATQPGQSDGPKSSAFRALGEREAKLRREQQAFEATRAEAQAIVDWFKAVQADPSKLAEKLGADIFERGARVAAGAPPKPEDPNKKIQELTERLDNDQRQRNEAFARAQTVQAHQTVRGMLEKVGDDYAAVVAFGKENEVFDGFSLYLKNEGIKVHEGRYFASDGTPLAPDFEQKLVFACAAQVNKDLVDQYGAVVEKVPQFRSRFAPAPAAAAPAAATPAAPPQASTPPAREAPAPATLTSRHGNDAAPSVSNGRRKTVQEHDDEIVAQFFGN